MIEAVKSPTTRVAHPTRAIFSILRIDKLDATHPNLLICSMLDCSDGEFDRLVEELRVPIEDGFDHLGDELVYLFRRPTDEPPRVGLAGDIDAAEHGISLKAGEQ